MGLVSTDNKEKSLEEMENSNEFVTEYFGRSVLLFRDDTGFMQHLGKLLESELPTKIKLNLIQLYQDELIFDLRATNESVKESSQNLQKKCTLLYLLASLCQGDSDSSLQLLEEVTIPLLQLVTFATRFPIQEKYFACLYLGLLAQVREARVAGHFDDEVIDLQLKTRVF